MFHGLERAKKTFYGDTHRIKGPEETIRQMEPLMQEIGVSSLEEITSGDRIGIPCMAVIRPSALLKVSRYHVTSGTTLVQAKAAAMMAAFERFASEYRGQPMAIGSYEEIGITRAVDPRDLFVPRALELGEKIHWTEGYDILNMESAYVPSNTVFHPYDTLGVVKPLFMSDTLGLASGNAMEEGILHALMEVIECDTLSLAERGRIGRRSLEAGDHGTATDLLDRFASEGIEIHLWALEGRCGIPTIVAASDDTVAKDPLLLVMGTGTHLSPEVALIEALLRVARNRMIQLTGSIRQARDQLVEQIGYERMRRFNRAWFSEGKRVGIDELPDWSSEYIDEEIRFTLERLRAHTDRVVLCDLSIYEIPVVRAVVPKFEVSYIHKDRTKMPRQ